MSRKRLPPGEDWKDHAEPCPCCGEPVLSRDEHLTGETFSEPGFWTCDPAEEEEDSE